MSANDIELWHFLRIGNVRAVSEQLFSSAIPSSEVAGTGRHSQDETGPEVLGGFPPADRGPATVGVLRLNPAYERFIGELYTLLGDDRVDEAYDLVRAEHRAIHGPRE